MTNAAQSLPPVTLTAGNAAPNFQLTTDKGAINLADFKGKNVVLYFYPKDDTPGCTMEAKDFRDHLQAFTDANTTIIGVSKDSVQSHGKFQQKYCLPFTLGSDETGNVCEDYGVWGEKSMYGKKYMGIERATFLIDAQGTLRHIWRKVKVDGHVKDVLAASQKLGTTR